MILPSRLQSVVPVSTSTDLRQRFIARDQSNLLFDHIRCFGTIWAVRFESTCSNEIFKMATPSYYNDHNRNGLLKFKIELTFNGKRVTANRGLRYIPKTSVLKVSRQGHLASRFKSDRKLQTSVTR